MSFTRSVGCHQTARDKAYEPTARSLTKSRRSPNSDRFAFQVLHGPGQKLEHTAFAYAFNQVVVADREKKEEQDSSDCAVSIFIEGSVTGSCKARNKCDLKI